MKSGRVKGGSDALFNKRAVRGNFALLLLGTALLFPVIAHSEDVYKYPEIKPTLGIKSGYRFVGLDGSERADEYEYLKDSVPLWTQFVAFPFPHRLYLEVEFLNEKDYFGDARYAYKDIVLSRWMNRTLFHNLENLAPLPPLVETRDAGVTYARKAGLNDIFLRLKTPYYPFHVYASGHFMSRDGSMQQIFLGGSGWFNNPLRVSERRKIKWDTREVTVGANSHLGVVEIDYSHSEKKFDSGGDRFLIESYSEARDTWPPYYELRRAAGGYPHHLISDLTGTTDTVKLHTSYTGKLVGSATLSRTARENEDSGAKAEYFTGAGELKWSPLSKLTFNLKYRRRQTDMDNPDSLDDGYYGLSTNPSALSGIKPSVSSTLDTVIWNVRFMPDVKKLKILKSLSLNAEYIYKGMDRENAEDWKLPDKTTDNSLALAADARLPKALQLKLRYRHRETSHPAYNSQASSSDGGAVSLKWVPVKSLTAVIIYNLTLEERQAIPLTGTTTDRDVSKHRLTGSLTFLMFKDLTLIAGYAFMKNGIKQDLILDGRDPAPIEGDYEDTAHNYSARLNYAPKDRINLDAEILHTANSGEDGLELKETVYVLSAEQTLKGSFGVGVKYKHINLQSDSPEVSSGKVNIALLTASKRW